MRYRVKAIRDMSNVALLPIEAINEQEASAHVQRQGFDVISVQPERAFSLTRSSGRRPFPVIQVSQELIALLKAGLTLVEAIEILHRKEERASHKVNRPGF